MIFLEACLYLVVVLTGLVVVLALSWAAVHLSADDARPLLRA